MSDSFEHTPEASASLTAVFLSTHDELWSQMRPHDAPLVRLVLARAAELERTHGSAVRLAFLSGVAVAHAAERVANAVELGQIQSIEDELAKLNQAS